QAPEDDIRRRTSKRSRGRRAEPIDFVGFDPILPDVGEIGMLCNHNWNITTRSNGRLSDYVDLPRTNEINGCRSTADRVERLKLPYLQGRSDDQGACEGDVKLLSKPVPQAGI